MYYYRWSNAEKYHALQPCILNDLLSFANVFLRNVKLEVLIVMIISFELLHIFLHTFIIALSSR